MFRSLSSWFGLEQPAAGGRQSQGDGQGHAPPDQCSEAVAESAEGEPQLARNQELLHQAKGLGKRPHPCCRPWVWTTNDRECGDKRNFLRDPPAGVQFNFDFDQMYPVALVMLQEDELLSRMRFDLVPKLVKEDVFWRNYFYRVSLIKQSQQAAEKEEKNHGRQKELPLTGIFKKGSCIAFQDEEEISTSPCVSEFVSDAFDSCNLDQEDLRKEMEQLVLDKKEEGTAALEEDSVDWEKELQQELQEYEVVAESEKRDENWDKEIEEMLKEEN
uniref:BSD domain-containing protein n=1 Tax=Capra hircus TaxID=9925 RepID=A0A8C2RNL5_CAPHI